MERSIVLGLVFGMVLFLAGVLYELMPLIKQLS